MPEPVNPADLPPEVRKKLGLKKPRKVTFTKDRQRTAALKCLATIADLTQTQRRQVLKLATRINEV